MILSGSPAIFSTSSRVLPYRAGIAPTFPASTPNASSYAKTGGSGSYQYADIPTSDVRYLLNYAEAQALRSMASALAVSNKKIGDTDTRGDKMAAHLEEKAERLIQEFVDAFPQSVVVRT